MFYLSLDVVHDAVALFDESDMLFVPDESFSYSSLGFVLLSAAMQVVANQSYPDLMFDLDCTPIKMLEELKPLKG